MSLRGLGIAIFGPNPILAIVVESAGSGEDVHLHAGGQGVWVARMAGELGAHPVLCGLRGGETGTVLDGLLAPLPGERRLTTTAGGSGCYVVDRRGEERKLVAQAWSPAPTRHELDDLVSEALAAALGSRVFVVCNPFPAESFDPAVYANLVTDARANGTLALVDLSTPRLERALEGEPDLVKLNDWELAEYVCGPVDTLERRMAAAQRLCEAGAQRVVVTRGPEPALVLLADEAYEVIPPRFELGSREGCGDSMMGGLSAALVRGEDWLDAIVTGAAAGAANFLRRGLGTGQADVVAELRDRVEVRPVS